MLYLRLLGTFHASLDDQPISALSQPRTQKLLAYLLLHRREPQSRHKIAFLFWPDSTDVQAQSNLRTQLTRLRRQLPNADRYISSNVATVQWRTDSDYVLDVARLEAVAARWGLGDAAIDASSAQTTEEILALYSDDLLPTFYDDWLLIERKRLHELFSAVLLRLVTHHESRGELPRATRCAERLLRHDPLREEGYLALMRLYVAQGKRAQAGAIYRQCVEILQRELQVEPSAAITRYYDKFVREADPPRSLSHRSGRTQEPTDSPLIPLIGRRAELEELDARWRGVTAGRAGAVVLSGVAGIGKTRLAAEFAHHVADRGATVVRTQAYAASGALAYAPLIDWLQTPAFQTRLETLSAVWLTELARLVPQILVERPDLSPPPPMQEDWQRHRFHEALLRVVLSANEPQLLLLDDLHWCDGETLAWLHHLLRSAQTQPLLLLCTARVDEIDPDHPLPTWLRELRRHGQLHEIQLAPLNQGETAQIGAAVRGGRLDQGNAAQLYRHSEGNPLFAIELSQTEMLSQPPSIPPTIRSVIEWRLHQLSSPAQRLAQAASVLGREFAVDILRHLTGMEEESFADALHELAAKQIVRHQGEMECDFTHDMVHQVAHAQLSSLQRRLWHRRAGHTLVQLRRDPALRLSGQIAAHFEAGQAWEAAVAHHLHAAEAEQQVYAHASAMSHLDRALTLLTHLPESVQSEQWELQIQLQRGVLLIAMMGAENRQVGATFARADALARRVGTPAQRFAALRGLAEYYLLLCDFSSAHHYSQSLMELAQEIEELPSLLHAHAVLGMTLVYQGEYDEARRTLSQVVELYGTAATDEIPLIYGMHPVVQSLCYLAVALQFLGYPDRATVHMERALALAEEVAHPYIIVFALAHAAILYFVQRRPERCYAMADRAERLGRRHQYKQPIFIAPYFRIRMQAWDEGLDEAGRRQFTESEAIILALDRLLGDTDYLLGLAEIAPDLQKGLAYLERAVKIVESRGEYLVAPELYRCRAELLWKSGADPAAVEPNLQRAIDLARRQNARWFELRATLVRCRFWREQGRLRDAHDALAAVYHWFGEGFDLPHLQEARGLLAELAAELASRGK